ncbi:MAG TPA: polysaccharide deacetylase family protein [Blastocatellia bacterium]|nr:polysaccharide deacetylase family protein [Blastocatellia bacterium]
MRVPGIERLKRAAALAGKRLHGQALILLYHRVAEPGCDPWHLSVKPHHFREHLEVLRKHARPMRLLDLVAALRRGRLPRRAVAVTFDDGYADNLSHAKPLLEKFDVPATVFVAVGYTGREREFWWDELDRLLLEPGLLPETLELRVDGQRFRWELGEDARYSEIDYQRNRDWRAWDERDPGRRQSLYRSLWRLMQPLADAERQKIRDYLCAWASADPAARASHRPMSHDEILALERGGLIEIGSHTITHPQLPMLSADAQRDEICHSKAHLEELVGHPVKSFAYPYGDYTDETVALAREAGFDCACSTVAEPADRHADPFRLPRLQAQDVDGEAFSRMLNEWFNFKKPESRSQSLEGDPA